MCDLEPSKQGWPCVVEVIASLDRVLGWTLSPEARRYFTRLRAAFVEDRDHREEITDEL